MLDYVRLYYVSQVTTTNQAVTHPDGSDNIAPTGPFRQSSRIAFVVVVVVVVVVIVVIDIVVVVIVVVVVVVAPARLIVGVLLVVVLIAIRIVIIRPTGLIGGIGTTVVDAEVVAVETALLATAVATAGAHAPSFTPPRRSALY